MSDPRMGWADAVMYGVEEDPLLRSVITVVMLLDSEPDVPVARDRIERMTLTVPKLRQRVVGNPLSIAPPRWEVDPNFDLNYHLRVVKAPHPDGTMRPVFELAEKLAEQDFDHARPLWEMLLISGLADGEAAFVVKIHHAITDGVGGMQMAAALFDLARETNEDLGAKPDAPEAGSANVVNRLKQGVSFQSRTNLKDIKSVFGAGTDLVKEAITDPIGMAAAAGEFAQSAGRVLSPASEPLSDVFGARSLSVYFDMIDIPLDDLKRAGKAAKGTLNDAFMAGVAGGLRKYHLRHGSTPVALRVNMPVNLRSPADAGTQGNRWAPARFAVPLNEADPAKRVQQLHPLLRQARTEPALNLSDQIFRLLTVMPRSLTTNVAGGMMKGTDFVATNVPGPPIPVYFAGSKILRMLAYAPKAGAAVNCALMSYNGTAQIGINIDAASVPDPAALVADLREGLDEVVALGRTVPAAKPAARAFVSEQAQREATPAKTAAAGKATAKRTASSQTPANRAAATKVAPAKKAPAKKAPAKEAPAAKEAATKEATAAKRAPVKRTAATSKATPKQA